MQSVAHLFNSPREHAMNVAELPDIATAYDKVGVYDQDAINGFSEQMLTTMLDTRLLYFGDYQVDYHLAMAVCCLANT